MISQNQLEDVAFWKKKNRHLKSRAPWYAVSGRSHWTVLVTASFHELYFCCSHWYMALLQLLLLMPNDRHRELHNISENTQQEACLENRISETTTMYKTTLQRTQQHVRKHISDCGKGRDNTPFYYLGHKVQYIYARSPARQIQKREMIYNCFICCTVCRYIIYSIFGCSKREICVNIQQ